MKTTIISLLTALVSAAASEDPIFQGAATKTVPVQMAYDSDVTFAYFTSIMQDDGRKLQGNGNDPTACSSTGVRFTCQAPSSISQGENQTRIDNTITCDLDDAIGMLFQDSENCVCNSLLTDQYVGGRTRNCACGVCPRGSAQAVSLDCTNNPDDPYVAGPCTSLSCDGKCNGDGDVVVNQPTPGPVGAEEPTPAPGSGSGKLTAATGVVLGAMASFVSVYVV